MTSKEMLGQLMAEHYKSAQRAKSEGRLVAWATSISPQELLETMDITVVYSCFVFFSKDYFSRFKYNLRNDREDAVIIRFLYSPFYGCDQCRKLLHIEF